MTSRYSFRYSNQYDLGFLGQKGSIQQEGANTLTTAKTNFQQSESNITKEDRNTLRVEISELNERINSDKKGIQFYLSSYRRNYQKEWILEKSFENSKK